MWTVAGSHGQPGCGGRGSLATQVEVRVPVPHPAESQLPAWNSVPAAPQGWDPTRPNTLPRIPTKSFLPGLRGLRHVCGRKVRVQGQNSEFKGLM